MSGRSFFEASRVVRSALATITFALAACGSEDRQFSGTPDDAGPDRSQPVVDTGIDNASDQSQRDTTTGNDGTPPSEGSTEATTEASLDAAGDMSSPIDVG